MAIGKRPDIAVERVRPERIAKVTVAVGRCLSSHNIQQRALYRIYGVVLPLWTIRTTECLKQPPSSGIFSREFLLLDYQDTVSVPEQRNRRMERGSMWRHNQRPLP